MTSNDPGGEANPAYLPTIEWEGLQQAYDVDTIDPSPAVPPSSEKMILRRNDAYRIEGTVSGELNHDFEYPQSGIPGSFSEGVTITGANALMDVELGDDGEPRPVVHRYRTYDLPDCFVHAPAIQHKAGQVLTFEISLVPWRVSRAAYPPKEATRLTEWYLNGPRRDVTFPRTMQRRLVREYNKWGPGGDDPSYPAMTLEQGRGEGYASIRYGDNRFLIYQIPKGCGPKWSQNIGIEFRAEWGGLPTVNDREAIGEIVSFVVGRRLIHVGSTGFGADGWPVEEISFNPWGDNVVTLCATPDRPPVKLDFREERTRIETLLGQLVPSYLDQRDELGLKDALWHYWLSHEAVSGIDLVIISTALEGLVTKWLKSNRSRAKGVHLPKAQFDDLTRGEFATIKQKLEDAAIEGRGFVMRALENAFQIRGAPVRRNKFLAEINLRMGPVEEEAFDARNPVAHGGGAVSQEEHRRMIRHGNAYHIAFARIILKLLGYIGPYIDYSAPGFPEIPLEQPLAGWSDEGVEAAMVNEA